MKPEEKLKASGLRVNKIFSRGIDQDVAQVARSIEGFELVARPARAPAFVNGLAPHSVLAELKRPCHSVLVRKGDPNAHPVILIEVAPVSEQLRSFYIKSGLPWVEVMTSDQNGYHLTFSMAGYQSTASCHDRKDLRDALVAALGAAEKACPFGWGRLIRSGFERDIVGFLKDIFEPIEVQVQVPAGYCLGQVVLSTPADHEAIRSEIDIVVTRSLTTDPSGAVLLAIKVDVHASHRSDPRKAQRDRDVIDLFGRNGVPLLVVTPSTECPGYLLVCPGLTRWETTLSRLRLTSWLRLLRSLMAAALDRADEGRWSDPLD